VFVFSWCQKCWDSVLGDKDCLAASSRSTSPQTAKHW